MTIIAWGRKTLVVDIVEILCKLNCWFEIQNELPIVDVVKIQ